MCTHQTPGNGWEKRAPQGEPDSGGLGGVEGAPGQGDAAVLKPTRRPSPRLPAPGARWGQSISRTWCLQSGGGEGERGTQRL